MLCLKFLLFLTCFVNSEQCFCIPLCMCNLEDILQYEDFNSTKLNMFGFPCESDTDICCKVRCGERRLNTQPLNDIAYRVFDPISKANFAEFPWMLAILYRNAYRCGGSLIHPQVALTAAHCVQKPGPYKVRAGEWDRYSQEEPLEHEDRAAKKIIVHPRYNSNSLKNDIALIIVNDPFPIQDNIGAACLPAQNANPIPEECVVTGWGKTSYQTTRHSNILNKATFPVVSHSSCEMALRTAHLGPSFKLDSSFMCAGGQKKDTCKGDGGSPLMCGITDDDNVYEQFGIVSWGLICGRTNAPGVYVSVAKFVWWIDKQMALHGLDSTVYKHKK